MRINQENKSVDMEARDINYILPAYIRSYQFFTKGENPERIIFPMFPSVKADGKDIPIEYVPPLDAIAVEIAEDGKAVAEVTPAQEAELDEKDEKIKGLQDEIKRLTEGEPETPLPDTPDEAVEKAAEIGLKRVEDMSIESPAKAAFAKDAGEPKGTPIEIAKSHPGRLKVDPDRKPRQPPAGDIGTGQPLSDMHARDRRDQARTAKDLVEEPDISEAEVKDFDKTVSRDDKGKPIVEDNPSASS